jgi:hypothetical protein
MFRRPGPLALAVCLLWTAAAPAQQGMLDLIPADAAAAVSIRSLTDLKKKGDQFVADAELKVPLRPSQLFEEMYKFLGVQGGVDEGGAAAIVLLRPEGENEEIGLESLEKLLVAALPVSDLDKLSACFGFKKGQLKPNKIAEGRVPNGPNEGKTFFAARGKHLYLAPHEKAIKRILAAKTVGTELTAAQKKSLGQADLLIHLGPKAFGNGWKQFLEDTEKTIGKSEDPEGQKVIKQFLASLEVVRFGFAAVRFDGGLGVSLVTVFPTDAKSPSREFLKTLRAGTATSNLKGLPEGNVLGAQASAGNGTQNALIARVFFDFLIREVNRNVPIVVAGDRPTVVGLFNQVWYHLRGSRFAVYQSPDETRLGLLSLVGILDVEDPTEFLAEMRTLMKITEVSADDLKKPASQEQPVDLDKLVHDLGSTKYRVRENATTALRLIGEPALSRLEKASQSADAEVARRASLLKKEIGTTAAERRKALLEKKLPLSIRPTFTYVPRAETRAGHAVDVVNVKLNKTEAVDAKQLQQLLGPEWDKLRVAVHGKHVVFLLGSEVGLLDATLNNLKDNKDGLAATKLLDTFKKRGDPGRAVELHVAAQKILALTKIPGQFEAAPKKVVPALTSFALSVDEDKIRLDIFIPSPEFRALSRNLEVIR